VRRQSLVRFVIAFAVATLAAFAVLLLEPDLREAVRTFWDRTIGFQLSRNSPFSLWEWGQYHARGIPDLGFVQPVLSVAAVALALVVAVVPRRKSLVQLVALSAAVLVAFELTLSHWFYLYLPWIFPFVALWLLLPDEPHQSKESRIGYEALAATQSAANSAAPMSPVKSE
jgi:hypothetical protein